jgi:uncharacterized protein (DUF2461 family)
MLKNKHLRETYGDLTQEDKLQRPPKGFDPEHPLVEYLKLKSYFVWTESETRHQRAGKTGAPARARIQGRYRAGDWLRGVPQTFEEE